ncbi:MAG: GPI inositol-deacylase [Xanthomonadaceae bacterium]|nr:GPI inositol-deacylase [Xanthomonadaceae bacterium]
MREQYRAIINGVLGDHLARTQNPLAIRNSLRRNGRVVTIDRGSLSETFPDARTRLLVTAHGLCMHDGQWHTQAADQNTPDALSLPRQLETALSFSVVDLHYNTGRHIWETGHEFSDLLENLVLHWPVEVRELVILGHSMGGLVARSATHHALESGQRWPSRLKKLIFLGTPHHGSPLERAGHVVDRALGLSRYSAPFTRLGKVRSAGITDLRHGNILRRDCAGQDRFGHAHDTRSPARLPSHVSCYAVAASASGPSTAAPGQLRSDGLVPVASALGLHSNPEFDLGLSPANHFIAYQTGHLALLGNAAVADKVSEWLQNTAS